MWYNFERNEYVKKAKERTFVIAQKEGAWVS